MEKHYRKEELDMYRNGNMSFFQKKECARHLQICPVCRKQMDDLTEDDSFLEELRTGLHLYEELRPKSFPGA